MPEHLTWRTIILTILVPIFVPLMAVLTGIWYTAAWTATQEIRFKGVQDRVSDIENREKGGAAHEARIGQIEFRLNWMDNEKNEYNKERRQVDREIRESLEKLKDEISRLNSWNPNRRRGSLLDELYLSPAAGLSCPNTRSGRSIETNSTPSRQDEDTGDQKGHSQAETKAR